MSSAERLPNGNTLICSGAQRRVFEVTSTGQVVFNHQIPQSSIFQAHYVDRSLWSSATSISAATGGAVAYDLLALGVTNATHTYVLGASASGTTPGISINGFLLPLNPDPVLTFTIQNANSTLLVDTIGTLDASGRATASVNLPSGINSLIGAQLDFAYAVLDTSLQVVWTSNPVPLAIVP